MLTRRDFLKLPGTLGSAAAFAPLQTNTPQYRRVVLFETHVAGFQFHDGMQPEVSVLLTSGKVLALVREPENPHDENAIAVISPEGHHLGYIPRSENDIPATLADQDVLLGAEITAFNPLSAPWERLRLRLRVFQSIPVSPS